jgi:hypothetical protein
MKGRLSGCPAGNVAAATDFGVWTDHRILQARSAWRCATARSSDRNTGTQYRMHLGNAGYLVSAPMVAAAIYVVFCYNRLVRARNMLQEGWSGIDVQLGRRADLVPNLIETVKGYAAHEHGIFEDLADKRAQSLAANTVTGQVAAEQAMQGRARTALRGRRSLSGAKGGR